jgi:hypothetical protein
MRYQLAAGATRLTATLCLMMACATGASAQINNCWMPVSPGPPAVNDAHIFCGEIRQNAAGVFRAVGFHSRPNGINPLTAAGPGVPIITNDNNVNLHPPGAPAGIYKIIQFDITQAGVTRTKAQSTMFPDACGMAAVLAAIRNAAGAAPLGANAQFHGMSGPGCLAGGAQFNIVGFTDANGVIDSAYPNY